jgi:Tfp pilus assembly protein PilF
MMMNRDNKCRINGTFMNPEDGFARDVLLALALVVLATWAGPAGAQAAAGSPLTNEIRILELQGTVEISPAGAATWVLTQPHQVLHPSDRLRTGPNSRVALRWSDQSIVPFGALTEIEILPPHEPGAQSGLHLFKGIASFFHRDKPGRIRVITRGAVAGVEGTEFVMAVETSNNVERTKLWLIDGKVQFSNPQGAIRLTNGQQGIGEFGKAPELLTAGFIANNVLQWAFYYPAVLDSRDLALTTHEQQVLAASLAAYREGDLLGALAKYPDARQPASDAERVYYAALLLSVGQVEKTEDALAALPAADPSEHLQRLATALRQLIAAVKRDTNFPPLTSHLSPATATELLAASYYEQSLAFREDSLRKALKLAREAATNSPEFGFAWARVAELEFSFGRTGAALDALNKGLTLSPSNAQALALKGFLLAAQNKTHEAIDWFNHAIAADSALGNAWLGRGLCKIRLGWSAAVPSRSAYGVPALAGSAPLSSSDLGSTNVRRAKAGTPYAVPQSALEDLLVAAALEPQRSLLRSYLGKAYGNAGDGERAAHEFDLAKRLDPNDPTPWLYSALLHREENRINEGLNDLERSVELNDNRRVYRSRLLLDEDRAVRSSSLANLYQSAGMNEVAVREAARAVSYDYGNYSGHLFLSDSFNALRDPTRFNLRYETVWFNELLLANLLSPVGGTPLSQHISQQEYSRLFTRDRIGLSTDSSYRSDGQYRELASQFGVVGNFSYAFDLDYQHNDGVRPNNELDRIEWYTTLKYQLTPRDSLFLLTKYQDFHSGDNFQYYDPTASARPNFNFDEFQSPIILGGYHHQWTPGSHTLFLGGRLENDQRFSDKAVPLPVLFKDNSGILFPPGTVTAHGSVSFDASLRSQFEAWTAELQQIQQSARQTLIVGGRLQSGNLDTRSLLTNPSAATNLFNMPAADAHSVDDFARATAYAYYTVEPIRESRLLLTAGLAYDYVHYPLNFRAPPIQTGETSRRQWSPKAALIWTPAPELTLRGVYTRSLGGVTLDESFRLEPSQLAGFSQTFRTIIPESLVGSVSAPAFETWGAALDWYFNTRTYIGLQADLLSSKVSQTIGVFDFNDFTPPIVPSSTPQRLNYREQSAAVTVNQLLTDEWSLGAQYRFAHSSLDSIFPAIATFLPPPANRSDEADLHRLSLNVLFNHPSGFYALAESQSFFQHNASSVTRLPGDSFQQLNFFAGYRFRQERAEITVGALNVTDQDYRLNPLSVYQELPRKRVFYARVRFRF